MIEEGAPPGEAKTLFEGDDKEKRKLAKSRWARGECIFDASHPPARRNFVLEGRLFYFLSPVGKP